MEFFQRLGELTTRLWHEKHFDEASFADVAISALAELPPIEQVDAIGVLRSFLRSPNPVLQPSSNFGEPQIVVYRHRRFYIQALYWVDGTTALHQHKFSGAFHVLAGSSIHGRYRFVPETRTSAALWTGKIDFKSIELLEKGDTRRILAGNDFIHSLFHLHRPSVTIVIRTWDEPDKAPQFSYLRPWVAFDPYFQDDRLERAKRVFDLLATIDPEACEAEIDEFVLSNDLTSAFFIFLHAYGFLRPRERFDEIAERARKRHGEQFEKIIASLEEGQWLENITTRREEVVGTDHRFFLALLLNVPTRADILRLVKQRTGEEPVAKVMQWIRELTTVGKDGSVGLLGLELEPDESDDLANQLDTVLHAVLQRLIEGRPSAIEGYLRERFSPGVVARQAENIQALRRAIEESAFRNLVAAD